VSIVENGDRLDSPSFRPMQGRARFLPYALQLLLIFISFVAWEILLQERILGNELTGPPLGIVGFQIANAAAIGLIGLVLGLVIQRVVPSAARTGRWVWLLPVSVMLLAILWDFIDFGPRVGLTGYFFCAHPGRDETCVVRDLLTYPTWSAAWYSGGMALSAIRERRNRRSSGLRPPGRVRTRRACQGAVSRHKHSKKPRGVTDPNSWNASTPAARIGAWQS